MARWFGAAALAAGLVLAAASPAAALEELHITHTSMNTAYTATIHFGGGGSETAYSNGIVFTGTNLTTNESFDDLFGFCIDVFHNITLGNQNLNYWSTYDDPNYVDIPVDDFGAPTPLTDDQKKRVTSLVDYGFELHRDFAGDADAELQLAAVQAAIWNTILQSTGGYVTINNASHSAGGLTYAQYFNAFAYTNTYDGDRIYEIFDTQNRPAHQAFAIGWPIEGGVPEPGTWALMLAGFFGMDAALRRSRRDAGAAAV